MAGGPDDCERLMRLALAGDGAAYQAALRESARLCRHYLARRLNSASDIEDVVQEILLSVHKARHTYDGARPFRPWLFAIAKFRLQDFLRAHYGDKLRHAAELTEAENISAGTVTESAITYEEIKGEIRLLPGKSGDILDLLHGEGYTAREAAEKIGMTESAVKVAAHRAYKILRKRLTGQE